MNRSQRMFSVLFVGLVAISTQAATNHFTIQHDIEYARVGALRLNLDLYLPPGKARTPLIVWVHGGAWRSGSKTSMPLGKLVEAGHPIASVDYRLSTQGKFPAQVHDIKAAIRFLRSHGEQWNLSTKNIVV